MNTKHAIIAAALVSAFAAGPASAQNLLTNGSFEQGTFSWDGNGAQSLGVTSTVMTGWTVVNAELAPLNLGNIWGQTAQDGSVFLDLTGYHDHSPYGGVEQTLSTVVGQEYQVQFYIGINNSVGGDLGPASVDLGINGSHAGTFTNNSTESGQVWTASTYSFTASSTSTTFDFVGSSTAGGNYIGLDNISVQAVPEPSSLILAAGSVLGLLGFRRRRS